MTRKPSRFLFLQMHTHIPTMGLDNIVQHSDNIEGTRMHLLNVISLAASHAYGQDASRDEPNCKTETHAARRRVARWQ